jgi:hypothetical protein
MSHVENVDAAYGWLPWPAETPASLSVAITRACFKADRLGDAEREYRAAIQADRHSGMRTLAVVEMLTGQYADARREVSSRRGGRRGASKPSFKRIGSDAQQERSYRTYARQRRSTSLPLTHHVSLRSGDPLRRSRWANSRSQGGHCLHGRRRFWELCDHRRLRTPAAGH